MRLALVLGLLLAAVPARADPPRWTDGPNRTYRCTRYTEANDRKPGEPLALLVSRGKRLDFRLRATAGRKATVRYEATGLPAGATLDGRTGRFRWQVAGTPGQSIALTLAAVADGGGRAEWPLTLTLVGEDLELAWKAGFGAPWPDCKADAAAISYEVRDVDGDGQKDVVYLEEPEETVVVHTVKLQRRGRFVEAFRTETESTSLEFLTAPDGRPLMAEWYDCCCVRRLTLHRLDGDAYVEIESWEVASECAAEDQDKGDIELTRDARGRVSGVVETHGRSRARWVWRNGTFAQK